MIEPSLRPSDEPEHPAQPAFDVVSDADAEPPGQASPAAEIARAIKSGLGWLGFTLVASVINTVSIAWGFDRVYGISLVSSWLVAGIGRYAADEAHQAWPAVLGAVFGLVFVAMLGLLTWIAHRGRPWSFALAAAFVAADAALALLAESGVSLVMHAICVFFVFRAWQAASRAARDTTSPLE